ncbi:MAG TPA: DinB family protein [Dehalococcoidia bacterium]|nr:DinB family protein [Dehalococcoidia bacterium]
MPLRVASFFEQSAWANDRLIHVCESLTLDQLEAAGRQSFDSIRETLVHLVATEQRYIRRLGSEPFEEAVAEGDTPGFDLLRRALRANGELLASMAASANEGWTIEGDTDYGVHFEGEAVVLLVQVLGHSAGHRQQIISMLSAISAGPDGLDEQLDGWSWGEATGALRTHKTS